MAVQLVIQGGTRLAVAQRAKVPDELRLQRPTVNSDRGRC
jgi:hypothetical protein